MIFGSVSYDWSFGEIQSIWTYWDFYSLWAFSWWCYLPPFLPLLLLLPRLGFGLLLFSRSKTVVLDLWLSFLVPKCVYFSFKRSFARSEFMLVMFCANVCAISMLSSIIVACLTKIWVLPKSDELVFLLTSRLSSGEFIMKVFFLWKFLCFYIPAFLSDLFWSDLTLLNARWARSSPEELAGYILVTYFVYMVDM